MSVFVYTNPCTSQDCYSLNSGHWYGGGEAYDQHWPIEGDNRPEKPYVTGDTFSGDFGGLMEPYWLNSNGFAIHADKDIPLLASLNASGDGQLCLAARYQSPYKKSDQKLHLGYSICSAADVKSVHLLAASKFWKKPSSTADERMFTHPIWSTWARYKTQIDQNLTLQFASEIRRYGFNDRLMNESKLIFKKFNFC